MTELTHFDDQGASRMVNVGGKAVTERMARAESLVTMQPETLTLIRDRKVAKGDVFEVARLAGIMATKRTADLIPLCHPLGLDSAEVNFEIPNDTTVRIETTVRVAALTIYDMCKSVDRGMTLGPARLLEKSGGKSGHFVAESG